MTNEQINRGMKYLHILDSGLENPKMYVKDMMKVLEAMKEPEEDSECKYCYNLKPGKWIPVDSIKKPRCSACGKKLYQDKQDIYIDPEYREQFDKDVARDIKIGTPDPIREVYEKWKEHYPENWVGCCGMTPYAETGMFANDMWNAIKQHCEEK